jgi:hypothetical protein
MKSISLCLTISSFASIILSVFCLLGKIGGNYFVWWVLLILNIFLMLINYKEYLNEGKNEKRI